jgi:Holliday junction resolvase RusA-like endonuclease
MWHLVLDEIVYGQPVAKGRPRAFRAGKMIRMYTPENVKKYEKMVGAALWAELPRARRPVIPRGPVRLELNAFHARPKRLMRKKDPDGPMMMDVKPDADNVLKAVMDAVGLAPVWTDDAQVCSVLVNQWRCSKDGKPRIELKIYEWKEPVSEKL